MTARCNIPMHECIVHCSPVAAGECTCLSQTEDTKGDNTAMRPLPNYFRHLLLLGHIACSDSSL